MSQGKKLEFYKGFFKLVSMKNAARDVIENNVISLR